MQCNACIVHTQFERTTRQCQESESTIWIWNGHMYDGISKASFILKISSIISIECIYLNSSFITIDFWTGHSLSKEGITCKNLKKIHQSTLIATIHIFRNVNLTKSINIPVKWFHAVRKIFLWKFNIFENRSLNSNTRNVCKKKKIAAADVFSNCFER